MVQRWLPPEVDRLLAAGGSAGALIRDVDWASTPIGEPAHWPQSLRTAIGICLESRFPMLIWWGPDLVKIYNDAYTPMLGEKHPTAMGQRGADCWPEIWDTIGPMLDGVLAGRGATFSEDQLLPLVRHGFAEECYFTFSYSPIRDETGGVGGVFTAVTETTGRVIGARRLAMLRELGQRVVGAGSAEQLLVEAAAVLDTARADVPLAVLYRLDGGRPAPIATAGALTPDELRAVEAVTGAVLAEPGAEGTVVELDRPVGPHRTKRLVVLPIETAGFAARLVAGASPALPFDRNYRSFLGLVAGQVTTGLAEALGYEAERARAEALAELDQAKTAFFTNISHEFRTPLTLLLGPTEDALADVTEPLGARQRPRAELVRRNALRLLKLVNALLDFSRLEAGRLTARYEPIELGSYTAELASLFRSAVEGSGLEFVVDCPPLPDPVYVDREMWEKIVFNLLSNALKFTFDGRIAIRLHEHPDHVALEVTDTGIGIAPSDQTRLFERFFRVQGAASRTIEGSGIGLALVAELARLHGGDIALASTPGDGSTFTVTIPRGYGHLPAELVARRARAAGQQVDVLAAGFVEEASRWYDPNDARVLADGHGTAPPGSARVLVVDDNADMRAYVGAVLRDDFEVWEAPDGAAALEHIRVQPPDLVLTDVMMPRLDGFGLLARLRADPKTAHLPVVILSARAGDEAAAEGLDAGADDYLVKPFTARELKARVRALLTLETMRRERGRDRRLLAELQTHRAMLNQAQRLSRVGSWEADLTTGRVSVSEELARQLQLDAGELTVDALEATIAKRILPDDLDRMRAAVAAVADGQAIDEEVRVVTPDGQIRTYRALGEIERDAAGRPVRLVGSNQDVTEQRKAEHAMAAATATREAAAREHSIADALQRSLLPADTYLPDHLDVATYYRPGTEGTQVGGDWFDVVELGAGRAALVVGDVMGRGVRAAAVMGQLRAAVRAYARLDLPPADILELLDGVVRDLGEDQIVTCVYAVYDPAERTLTYANAGHLPPLLRTDQGCVRALTGSGTPPLGSGVVATREERVVLEPGAVLTLYTDGLVERRDRDLDAGIDVLARALSDWTGDRLSDLPAWLADKLGIGDQDDDVAVLAIRVRTLDEHEMTVGCGVGALVAEVPRARSFAAATFLDWAIPHRCQDDALLLVTELVTNAVLHGRPPIELRLRRTARELVIEVRDGASFLPRRLRPSPDDEHGRGLQLVEARAHRWGARPTAHGKATWCTLRLDRQSTSGGS